MGTTTIFKFYMTIEVTNETESRCKLHTTGKQKHTNTKVYPDPYFQNDSPSLSEVEIE